MSDDGRQPPTIPCPPTQVATKAAEQVDVYAPFPFHMHALAGELNRQGLLQNLFAAVPKHRIQQVPADRLRTHPYLAVVEYGVRHATGRQFSVLRRAMVTEFDRWASRRRDAPARVVVGHSSFATHALREAAAQGSRIICDRGSWHILEQRRIVENEYEKWGLPRNEAPFYDWLVERELSDYDLADLVVVPSTAAARSFERQGVDRQRLQVNPYGVDLRRFHVDEHAARDAYRIISVGTVSLRKGQQYLIEAYNAVRSSRTSLDLVGALHKSSGAFLHMASGPDIELTGHVSRSRVAERMQRAAVFALASVEEGLAMVIVEAMACGLPVVVSEATGGSDIVEEGVTGFVVPAGDAQALADRLHFLLSTPDVAREMGMNAARWATQQQGWSMYGERAANLVRRLASEAC